jgi:DNA-binding transcriptional LysR family regulator
MGRLDWICFSFVERELEFWLKSHVARTPHPQGFHPLQEKLRARAPALQRTTSRQLLCKPPIFWKAAVSPTCPAHILCLQHLIDFQLRAYRNLLFIKRHLWANPIYYDRIINACIKGGLKTPRIVQHTIDHATMLSLVSCRLGVAFVSETTRWQCPRGVTLLPVVDLDFPVPFY